MSGKAGKGHSKSGKGHAKAVKEEGKVVKGEGQDGDQMENMTEIQNRFSDFDSSLTDLESLTNQILHQPLTQVSSQLSTLEKAKFDLLGSFAMTSLFWMYLHVHGVNASEHPVKQELDRIKSYMLRARNIEDKINAPRINKDAGKRLVRNALWQAAQSGTTPVQKPSGSGDAYSGNTPVQTPSNGKATKRSQEEKRSEKKSKKQKNK